MICPNEDIENIDQAIEKLEAKLPVNIKKADQDVYIIIPVRTNIKIKVLDGETNELLPLAHI